MISNVRASLRLSAFFLILTTLISGCFVLERDYPEKTMHLVSFQSELGVEEQCTSGPSVYVTAFGISPGFDTRELVVRTGETEYEPDFYNEYFVPPVDAVRAAAVAAVTESTAFRGSGAPTYQLTGHVRRLGGDLRDTASPKAYLDLQLVLSSGLGGVNVLHERSFVVEEPVDDGSSEQIFEGLCRATTRALREFVAEAAAKLPEG